MLVTSETDDCEFVANFFKDQTTGSFLEIGAHDGEIGCHGEPCWRLLEKNWKGVYCEPNPTSCSKLIKNLWTYRENIRIYNMAISSDGRMSNFYIPSREDHASCSSFKLEWIREQSFFDPTSVIYSIVTNTTTLDKLLEFHGNTDFDFIAIDIEGADVEVIPSINWAQFTNLKLLCIESPTYDTTNYLISQGFESIGMSKYQNMFFVKNFG